MKNKRRKTQLTLLNIKVSPKDRKILNAAAKKFEGGNLSAWLRRAGMQYKPGKSHKLW